MKKILNLEIYSETKQGIILSFIGLVCVLLSIFFIFRFLNIGNEIIGEAITGIIIIFGYFLTHYLEIQRKQQERKLENYSELLKSIRVFILEQNLSAEEKKGLAGKFQDAYLGSSLFISYEAFIMLKIMIEKLIEFQKEENDLTKNNFTLAQSDFVNCLRKEIVGGKNIEFNTYELR